MICRKCDNHISTGTKCFQCGYDNGAELTPSLEAQAKKYRRSPILVAAVSLFVAVDIFKTTMNIADALGNRELFLSLIDKSIMNLFIISRHVFYVPMVPNPIYPAIQIAVISIDILLLLACVVKLDKRAFRAYIGLTVLEAIMQIPSPVLTYMAMIPFILRGVLLLVVYMTDVKRWKSVIDANASKRF